MRWFFDVAIIFVTSNWKWLLPLVLAVVVVIILFAVGVFSGDDEPGTQALHSRARRYRNSTPDAYSHRSADTNAYACANPDAGADTNAYTSADPDANADTNTYARAYIDPGADSGAGPPGYPHP